METYEKIRMMRELNKWSQEEMAERLDMSAGGYAKIERGESQLNIARLEQIAKIFNINILELIKSDDKGFTLQISGDNSSGDIAFYNTSQDLILEVEKLKLKLIHAEELLAQKERENIVLQKLIASLEAK